ncbi:MAG: hypothetical protein OEY61_00965 [Gammaproteobacteria bacterium]|nr:hypothetical protein [Gammaproteobacteria bacterium]
MNKIALLTSLTVTISALMTGCSNSDVSPFAKGGGYSTNIISSTNFGITASELNPQVLEFTIGSIPVTSDTTANWNDLVSTTSPVESEITVTAADNNGALVSSGTVYFATQYGILSAPSCQIVDGRCSVTWQSIADISYLYIDPTTIDIVNNITAWTNGVEGFIDLDGDDRLSDSEAFFDTEEPYLDRNDNDTYDAATDDTIINTIHAGANGVYDGPACDVTTRSDCGSSGLKPIFATVRLRLNYEGSTPAFAVTIDTPANAASFASGASISFSATATDPEDGNITGLNTPLTGNNIVWSSDLDGVFGTSSNNVVTNALVTVGTHTITVTATDSNSNTTTATIVITIT